MMLSVSSAYIIGILYFLLKLVLATANWTCPPQSRYCYRLVREIPQNWNETRIQCTEIGGDLPGADHLNDLGVFLNQHGPFWTSLCLSNGRLQWLGINPYEESDLLFMDKLLPDLISSSAVNDNLYCFHTTRENTQLERFKPFGLTIKSSQHLMTAMCVSNHQQIRSPTGPLNFGDIISVSIITEDSGVDRGPIRINPDEFINIYSLKSKSFKLKCDVETPDTQRLAKVNWLRNGAYIGNHSQVVTFYAEDSLIPWIGFITCEALDKQNEAVQSPGFHLVMWNTVTAKLTFPCEYCRLQKVLEDAKNILRLFVETEIVRGSGRATEFYTEPPVFQGNYVFILIHIRNKRIDKFDFKIAQKLDKVFPLSEWAESRSLFLSSGLNLEVISPCNMALPQDYNNVTWVGYLGQTVPSGNFIDGPICVDNQGDIITRSCGLAELPQNQYQECSVMKPRREEPRCFHNFELVDERCYRMTERVNFVTALAQCWAGWEIQPEVLMPNSLVNWVQFSREWMYSNHAGSLDDVQETSLVWVPLRRLNSGTSLQTPVWVWNTDSNKWISQPTFYNITEDSSSGNALCAAYDLKQNRMIAQPCQNHLPMVCNRPVLPQPISAILNDQPDHVGEYFCQSGWLTHWLVLDSGICYKRFTLKEAIDADEAQQFCYQRGSHLATAPTHTSRLALEQVYAVFNNRSVVDSWIGLRSQGDRPGAFSWLNEKPDSDQTSVPSSTYSWQPYSELGSGYGVSMGISRMWWSRPRKTKLWGVLCQKTVSDWRNGLRLRLQHIADPMRQGEYALDFTYNPEPVLEEHQDQMVQPQINIKTIQLPHQHRGQSIKLLWQSDFDVVCHFGNYVRRFSFPGSFRRHYRALVPLPTSMGSGPLTCEAWLNKPAFRFQSNTIIHRSPSWFNFVLVLAISNRSYSGSEFHPGGYRQKEKSAVDDLKLKLDSIRYRFFTDRMSNLTVKHIGKSSEQEKTLGTENVLYRITFFFSPNIQVFEMIAIIRQCQNGVLRDKELTFGMDRESTLHLLLQSCMLLMYRPEEDILLVEVRSTVACPFVDPLKLSGQTFLNDFSPTDSVLTVAGLTWPRTKIGLTTRSVQPCWVEQALVRRSCMGSFDRGAYWSSPQIPERDKTLEAASVCESPEIRSEKFIQLERTINSLMAGSFSVNTVDSVLKELLLEWDQPRLSLADTEITISILRQIMNASQNLTSIRLDRLRITNLLSKIVQPGQCPLAELQYLPQVLDDFLELFSDLPVLGTRRTRINISNQVSLVAEGSESINRQSLAGPQPSMLMSTIDFDRVTVTVANRDVADAGYNGFLFTIVTVLPTELLAIDPMTKSNIIDIYAADASDPTQNSLLGKYTASQTTINIDFKEQFAKPTTQQKPSEPFTLAFKEVDDLPESTYVCARWDSRLSRSQGGWVTGNCWYMGKDVTGTHFCQCHSTGIYGLFHSDQASRLRLAFFRLLPITINAVSFLLIFSFLIIRSMIFYRKSVREMDFVEMGTLLQMVVAWAAMLFCHLGQYFVSGHMIGCIVLTTLFQFFLTIAFIWQCSLLVIKRWQIYDRWISHQVLSLVKYSFSVWILSSTIALTIPIYKWKYLQIETNRECWLEDPIDFGLSIAIVSIASLFSIVLNTLNAIDKKNGNSATTEWNKNDWFTVASTLVMAIAGLLAVISNSWMRSSITAIVFSGASLLLGFLWLGTFLVSVASPWVKHNFQHGNRKIAHDLHLKTVQSASIGYLADT